MLCHSVDALWVDLHFTRPSYWLKRVWQTSKGKLSTVPSATWICFTIAPMRCGLVRIFTTRRSYKLISRLQTFEGELLTNQSARMCCAFRVDVVLHLKIGVFAHFSICTNSRTQCECVAPFALMCCFSIVAFLIALVFTALCWVCFSDHAPLFDESAPRILCFVASLLLSLLFIYCCRLQHLPARRQDVGSMSLVASHISAKLW
jgi:hypothetical protein